MGAGRRRRKELDKDLRAIEGDRKTFQKIPGRERYDLKWQVPQGQAINKEQAIS